VVRQVHEHIEAHSGVLRFAAAAQYLHWVRKTLDATLLMKT